MKPRSLLVFCLALLAGALGSAPEATLPRLRGFTEEGSRRQRELEARFVPLASTEKLRAWHREFTAAPHPATSARNNELAEYVAEQWRAQGLEDVSVRRYDVLSSAPREVRVEMLEPERYVPSLREDAYPQDPDTAHPEISGAWLSFSASGDVTAPVVYANSGNPADYDLLRANGVDPRGKIALVRYSNPYSYRGFKALTAQREGAAAMLVYSDPAEDGFRRGKVFPDGPWGPESHIQRGGIAFDFIVPGDPLTPGWASTPGAHRIPLEEAVSVPRIVAVPMSHRDVEPILARLGGPVAPEAWQGGLELTYRLGGEGVRLRVKTDMQTDIQPNYVVEGRLVGSEIPDEWIVLGNHRDAWVFGGVDPSSGSAALMELTRVLGELKRQGIRPRRTLVFCSWDGEEVTLTGSTEWGEQLGAELKRKLVAYLNVDSAASGPRLEASAVGSLAPLLVELAGELREPSGVSLLDAWRRPAEDSGGPADGLLPNAALVRTAIGSGSDHTVFLNYLARPVVDMSFDGPYGVYHSAYDDHYWVERFGDPGFRYHALMVQLWGALALRLANAELLPFDLEAYAAAIRDFIGTAERIEDAADEIDFAGLVERSRGLRRAARRLNHRIETALDGPGPAPEARERLNRRLLDFEGVWLHPAGIPGRPWFKHLLYAPRYTYAAMTLPGLTEAAEAEDWPRAREQADLLADALGRAAALAEQAAAELPEPEASPLERRLRAIREGVDGRLAVYVEHLASGERVALDADTPYETFSVIKVPILAEALRRVEQGRLSLDQRVRLRPEQRRIPSGVLYALDPGLQPTLRDLLTLMIIVSDNQATDMVADLVGRDEVTRLMASLGLSETRLRFSDLDWDRLWLGQLDPAYSDADGDRTLGFPFARFPASEVSRAFRRVIEETGLYFGRSTARETGRLFALMVRGELVSPAASRQMIAILKRQQVNDRFPRYLGDGIEIAHKTGDGQPWVANDAGILWVKEQPIVLVAFANQHRGSEEEIHEALARIAAVVAHHFGGEVDPAGLR